MNVISEITLAEFQNRICIHERTSSRPEYNPDWADSCLNGLMRWIADGSIAVLEIPPKLIENAMVYVRFATRDHTRNLRSWDAAHLYQSCNWARSINQTVQFVTNDKDFPTLLRAFPEFNKFVAVHDPDVGTAS